MRIRQNPGFETVFSFGWRAGLGHAKLAIVIDAEEISVHPAPREA
jgi:hypothetical protein